MLIAIIKMNVNTNPRLFDSLIQGSVGKTHKIETSFPTEEYSRSVLLFDDYLCRLLFVRGEAAPAACCQFFLDTVHVVDPQPLMDQWTKIHSNMFVFRLVNEIKTFYSINTEF